MAQYSHFCEKCGWTSINDRGGYHDCPSCGVSFYVTSTNLNTANNLYNLKCLNCGWSSGPTSKGGISPCPNCGKSSRICTTKISNNYSSSSANGSSSSSGNYSPSSSSSESSATGILVLLALAALACGCIAIFFPGLLITMLIDIWAEFESKFWVWIWAIVFSLGVFLLCGFDWKKYLAVDVVLIIVFAILSWCIDKFSPFSWSWTHLFGN